MKSGENIEQERELADRILKLMPDDEEHLALTLGTTRAHVATLCSMLHKQHKIKLDRSWDAPRHWKAA